MSEMLLISASLQDKLHNKTKTQFWKAWNSKFKKKHAPNNQSVDELFCDQAIAKHFATKFKETCTPNSLSKDEDFKFRFAERIKLYKGDTNIYHVIDLIQLESIINNFELGKPSGV